MNYKKLKTRLEISFNNILLFILVLIELTIDVSSESKQIRNMETISFNSEPVFRVVVNIANNDVIVGGRNYIYRLSTDKDDLRKIDQFKTGPINDSIKCLPAPEDCEFNKKLVNNDNKHLFINYENKGFPLLFACGDGYQGQCIVFKSYDLSLNRTYGLPNNTFNFVGSKTSSYAFLAPSSLGSSVLYVAHAYDGRPIDYSPPSISSRRMNGFKGFGLTHDESTSTTKVDFDPKFKETFQVKYVFGFNYSHYSYFVSTQPISVRDTQEYETKLIRICQKDNEFFSYMEIPLICREDIGSDLSANSKHKNFDYLMASTAYFGKIGSKKYRDLDIRTDFDAQTLFVAMGVKTSGTAINKTIGSAICAFSLKQITKAFTEAAKECFRGGSEVHILEVIKGKREECQRIAVEVKDDFCGTGRNPYIGSNRPLNGLFLTSLEGHVTSLAVAVQNSRTVAAVGTDDGLIKKVIIDNKSESPLFEMNISDQTNDRSIRPDPAFDIHEKYLYLLSGNQLVKFPFGSCSLHTDCASCLKPTDPLRCGWCGSYCATDDECQTPTLMSRSMCPPEIFDFTPKSGPLFGGTIVTIIGDSLGKPHNSYENSNIRITIAGIECDVIEWESRRVQCKTNGVQKAVSAQVVVSVQDLTGGPERPYDINGTTTSSEEFRYLEPLLFGVYPSFGPIDGGTEVTIIGKNLHIGSNRTIFLASIQCKETDNNSTFLTCITGPQTIQTDDTSVRLSIDSNELIMNQNRTINLKPEGMGDQTIKDEFYSQQWSEYFEYKPNPKIYSYEPKATIRSGNTNITVVGINLNSVNRPRILVTALIKGNRQEVRKTSECRVSRGGTEMVCPTPEIDDNIFKETELKFDLDGVRGYANHSKLVLNYFPDPEFSPFDEKIRNVYLEEPLLKIEGKDLSVDYPMDILISKYQIPCNVSKKSSFNGIYCVIEGNDKILRSDGSEHIVQIKVGNIKFSPGSVKFSEKPTYVSAGTIWLAVLIPIIVISLVAIGVGYYLRSRGVFPKKVPPSVHYTSGTIENGDRPTYQSQHSQPSFNNYVPGEVTRPLLSVDSGIGRRYQASEDIINLLRAEHILIERIDIELDHVIGQGHFGCVYKGFLHSQEKGMEREVAVKTLHSSVIRDETDIDAFLQEGLMMKDFSHHHVLTLIGVCFEDEGTPIVVLPFMSNGDLLFYIRNEENNPTVKNLLIFAIEIAKGMDYLSSQKFVHRDLAARNCMLDSELCVKVADFGLSRDIYERDYYSSDNKKTKLPVKWMAPESLEKGTYNTKTDVWAYGVLVWELLTRGVTPYPDVDNWEILNYLKEGRRMPRPAFCPELLYFILLRCWSVDSKSRPTFAELVVEVQGVITTLEKGVEKQKVELDKCNTYINYPVPNIYYNDSQPNDSDLKQPKASTSETRC